MIEWKGVLIQEFGSGEIMDKVIISAFQKDVWYMFSLVLQTGPDSNKCKKHKVRRFRLQFIRSSGPSTRVFYLYRQTAQSLTAPLSVRMCSGQGGIV